MGLPSVGGSLPWTAAWLLFGGVFWWTTGPREAAQGVAGLVAQTLAAAALVTLGSTALDAACFVIVAAQLPSMLPDRASLPWIGVQTSVLAVCFSSRSSLSQALVATGAWGGFQFLAYGAAAIAEREARGRQELARLNADLHAARELLQGATRLAERVRIAREIHDAMGHHLTALSLNLEVAGQLAERLAQGLATPRVQLSVPDGLEVRDSALAHTVFRCVQEAVDNAVRHSEAKNLRIGVEWGPHGLEVTAADDGRGAEGPSLGNGLRGVRERLERLGGTLELHTAPGAGFTLRALLPGASEAP